MRVERLLRGGIFSIRIICLSRPSPPSHENSCSTPMSTDIQVYFGWYLLIKFKVLLNDMSRYFLWLWSIVSRFGVHFTEVKSGFLFHFMKHERRKFLVLPSVTVLHFQNQQKLRARQLPGISLFFFSDIDVDKPDKKLIIMYLTEMYNCMEGTKAKERKVGCCTLNKPYFSNVN